MELTIVYDNEIYRKNIGLKSDWGFACIIKNNDETILFDAGAKGDILLDNMEQLSINPKNISKIVISHEHWDHNGGLERLESKIKKDVEIYRFNDIKINERPPVCINESIKISENIYSTGRMPGDPVDEQSLILKGENGWYVLAGCSHSGVEKIFDVARHYGDVVGLIGGLHGFNNFPVLDGLKLVCPAHCSKYQKKIHNLFPDISVKAGVGKKIEI